ncbi:ankyrin repeat-containing domain protein [Penicillium hordei]|uniref:Ankyrin repeat-containing domain protein n=1 Tax=Penicillium hordei TaxID=40994 RepID=A0AAD6E7E0_9EURO|nr:ankyrin repeat-containing domain protein [Penicillium hordei]KAJ5603389.1 ankyrin repeat-containing domain protein [Penicillium hordei]
MCLASRIIQCGAHLRDVPSQSQRWAEHLSTAVLKGHEAMVELLCKAGVPPKVENRWPYIKCQSCLPILHTLLKYGADPESFVTGEKPGFPLIDAASNGSLGAVKLLLNAGARVDLYLPRHCGTALQAAASQGHLEVAKYLVQSGADVNVPSVELLRHHRWSIFFNSNEMVACQTPVQLATKVNNLALLQILLEHGASAMACPVSTCPDFEAICCYQATDFNRHRPLYYTPVYDSECMVHTALQYGVLRRNLNIVALLLFIGVAPDSRVAPGVGDTPLQMSARLGNLELVQLLLSSGADVKASPAAFNGRTAIQGAAESGNWKILSMLQGAGAQINAPAGAKLGMTALQAACLNGHSLMAGFLLAHRANLNAAPSPLAGLTPIQAASVHGDIGLVRELISLGADANAPATEMGSTALVVAVKHKSLPLLEILVQHGANVNLTGDCGLRSPLREAARVNWLKGVEFLLKHGANVDDTPFEVLQSDECADFDQELLSPLGWAISNCAEEMINLLVQHGADVLAPVAFKGDASRNALIYAILYGPDMDIIDLLLENVQDLENYPGWEDALKTVFENTEGVELEVCELIVEKTSSLPLPLRYKVIQNGWDALPTSGIHEDEENLLGVIKLLIKSGADLDSRSKDGSTLLQRIAGEGYHQPCCFLVGRGADINTHAAQSYGTALQEAIKNNDVKIADLLLEHGADVNSPALNRGVTPLQAASINGMLEMTVRLLECGADVSAPAAPEQGRTAIDGAAERGHLEMVQLLLNAYGEQEALGTVCNQAADYAEKEGHCELAHWLRAYSPA